MTGLSTLRRLYDAWDLFNQYGLRSKEEQIHWLMRQLCVYDSRYHSQQHIITYTADILANYGVLGTNIVPLPGAQQSHHLFDGWNLLNLGITTPPTAITDEDERIHFLFRILLNKGPAFENESEQEELQFVVACFMSM